MPRNYNLNRITFDDDNKALEPCPICGRKGYVMHSVIDGFDFGWDAGCPAFCNEDGIHGVTVDDPPSEVPRVRCLQSKQVAIAAWNIWVKNWRRKHGC